MKASFFSVASLMGMLALILMSFKTQEANEAPPTWKAPQSADTLMDPFTLSSATAIKEGEKTFKADCVACHGNRGKGDGIAGSSLNPRPANLLSEAVANQSDGSLFWKIENGKPPMPSWKDAMPAIKRWQVVIYIRELENKYGKGYPEKYAHK